MCLKYFDDELESLVSSPNQTTSGLTTSNKVRGDYITLGDNKNICKSGVHKRRTYSSRKKYYIELT